jgi:hypothetical protein
MNEVAMNEYQRLKFRWFYPILILMFFTSLVGCDTMVVYQFEVANVGTQRIDLAIQTSHTDTTMSMAASTSAMILERNQLNSGVKPYFEGADTIWWFSKLAITDASGRPVNKEVRLASFWTFDEKERKYGVYRLEIGDADF